MELRLRLFGIPVQVELIFFLIVWLIGRRAGDTPGRQMVWVALAFAGVLAHELGHALTARAFGATPRIVLYGMGGVTYWSPRAPLGAWKHVAVSAAGPGVGVALGLAAWVARHVAGLTRDDGLAGLALGDFIWINLGWGLFNLLPMMPLDGGNILAAGLGGLLGARGRLTARWVSIVVALAAGAFALVAGAYFVAALCALFIYTNVQGLRAERTPPTTAAAPPPE
jgi:stage IV sporulation protein FB